MEALRACSECNAGFSNTVIRRSGIDPEEIVSLLSGFPIKGKVTLVQNLNRKWAVMVSFYCLSVIILPKSNIQV